MKLLLGLMLLGTAAFSQILPASQVPAAIQHGFATMFPNVNAVEWKLASSPPLPTGPLAGKWCRCRELAWAATRACR